MILERKVAKQQSDDYESFAVIKEGRIWAFFSMEDVFTESMFELCYEPAGINNSVSSQDKQ